MSVCQKKVFGGDALMRSKTRTSTINVDNETNNKTNTGEHCSVCVTEIFRVLGQFSLQLDILVTGMLSPVDLCLNTRADIMIIQTMSCSALWEVIHINAPAITTNGKSRQSAAEGVCVYVLTAVVWSFILNFSR